MIFRYIQFQWHTLGGNGWSLLPSGMRPSDFVRAHPDSFTRTAQRGNIDWATCDTANDLEEALTRRISVRVAIRFGRSATDAIRQIRHSGGRKSISVLRRALCLTARTCGVSRDALALYMMRTTTSISAYTTEGRAIALADQGFRRACEDIARDENNADTCACAIVETRWVFGDAGVDMLVDIPDRADEAEDRTPGIETDSTGRTP